MDSLAILMIIVIVVGIAIFLVVAALSKKNKEESDNENRAVNLPPMPEMPSFENQGLSESEIEGMRGEMMVNFYLGQLIESDEYLITNALVPQQGGPKAEIDAIMVTRKGIFCIETKNWMG